MRRGERVHEHTAYLRMVMDYEGIGEKKKNKRWLRESKTNFTILCKRQNLRKMVLPLAITRNPRSLCRNFWAAQEWLCGCAALSASTHLTVHPDCTGMAWAWHSHPTLGSTCQHLFWTAAQSSPLMEGRGSCPAQKKERHQEGVEGQSSQTPGVFLLVRNRKGCLGKVLRRFYHMFLHEFYGFP